MLNDCKLDGADPHPLTVRCGENGFAIDFERNLFYYQDVKNRSLMRCNLDNTDHVSLLRFIAPVQRFFLDPKANQLYWSDSAGIARAQLPNPAGSEQVTGTNRSTGYRPWFAIDSAESKIYWTSYWYRKIPGNVDGEEEGFPLIVSEVLPPAGKKVTLPAPPLISSFTPSSAKAGDEVTVAGRGFQSAREVWWLENLTGGGQEVEYKTARRSKADFRVVSDTELAVRAPDLIPFAKDAALVVRAEGGVTVTLPQSLKLVAKAIKPEPTNYAAYLIRKGGGLNNLGNKLVFVDTEGTYEDALGGYDTVFVKNGGMVGGIGFHTMIFHEPFARLTFRVDDREYVPVGAIRPSFVDKLFVPLTKQ